MDTGPNNLKTMTPVSPTADLQLSYTAAFPVSPLILSSYKSIVNR